MVTGSVCGHMVTGSVCGHMVTGSVCGHMITGSLAVWSCGHRQCVWSHDHRQCVWSRGHWQWCSHAIIGSMWSVVTDSFWTVTDCDPSCSSKYDMYWSGHPLVLQTNFLASFTGFHAQLLSLGVRKAGGRPERIYHVMRATADIT